MDTCAILKRNPSLIINMTNNESKTLELSLLQKRVITHNLDRSNTFGSVEIMVDTTHIFHGSDLARRKIAEDNLLRLKI